MLCERHRLAAGPDGRCALCHRAERVHAETEVRHGDRRFHRTLRVVVGIAACLATYALLMALFDTRRPTGSSERRVESGLR
jgi:hypothetical protein